MQEHINHKVAENEPGMDDPKHAAHVFTDFYRNMFGLHGWAVTVEFPEEAKAFGACWYNYRLRQCKVKYEANQGLRSMEMTCAHEMMHLAMAPIENVFTRAIENLPVKTQDALMNLFTDECEGFVAVVSDAIVNLRRGEYSGEQPACAFCNTARKGLTTHQQED